MPPDSLVFPPRLRRLGSLYALAAVPACALAFWSTDGEGAYVRAMWLTGAVFTLPGMVLAVTASRRAAPGDRLVWRLWSVGWALGVVAAVVHLAGSGAGTDPATAISRSLVGISVLLIANTLMMQRRAGDRAVVVDIVDVFMATTAVVVPVALVTADRIVNAEYSWFTISSALWWIASVHGLFVALVMRARAHPDHRTTSHVGIVLATLGIVSATANVRHGLGEFASPAGPSIAAFAAFMATLTVFFLSSSRAPTAGLERLPPAAQVRRQSAVVVGVLAAVPLIGIEAGRRHDEPWVLASALAAVCGLLVLSSIRHLMSARETIRLYRTVEQAAADRGALLGEVMAHVDTDRHRVAAHLHRQAVSLYTSMATLTCALDRSDETQSPTAVTLAAEQLRRDLGRRADGLQRIATAVRPLSPDERDGGGLAAPIRAYVENLYGENRRPELEVSIDEGLVLDWTTEAILVRIVQEAAGNVCRHSRAGSLAVRIDVVDSTLRLEVEDDGVGATAIDEGRGISTMRSMARFLDGTLTVRSVDGTGTLVTAAIPLDALPEAPRPALRLVSD